MHLTCTAFNSHHITSTHTHKQYVTEKNPAAVTAPIGDTPNLDKLEDSGTGTTATSAENTTDNDDNNDDNNDDEHEEIPEDLAHLSPDEQQHKIKVRSYTMMAIGTATVLIFSDPMVGVLSEVTYIFNFLQLLLCSVCVW
jgi:hypothetical protein